MKGGRAIVGIVNVLRKEHFKLGQLLDRLEHEFEKLKQGSDPDYELINLLIDYLKTYPDAVHHRKEDLVFRALKEKLGADDKLFDLEAEHLKIDALISKLSKVVDRIELDQELPREEIHELLHNYITFMREHMSREERRFLPLAESYLGPNDWAAIAEAVIGVDHPMLDRAMADKGAALYREIEDYDAA